jgi:hypothetical protein
MTRSFWALPALVLSLGSLNCALADIGWKLDVTFTDGAVAQGVFTTNNAGTALESWNIQVAGGAAIHDFVSESSDGVSSSTNFGSLTTTPNPWSWPADTEEALEFADFGTNIDSVFYLGNLLTGDPINLVGALDCGGSSTCGLLQSGSIVDPPAATPEPASVVLFGSVAIVACLAIRRRTKNLAA